MPKKSQTSEQASAKEKGVIPVENLHYHVVELTKANKDVESKLTLCSDQESALRTAVNAALPEFKRPEITSVVPEEPDSSKSAEAGGIDSSTKGVEESSQETGSADTCSQGGSSDLLDSAGQQADASVGASVGAVPLGAVPLGEGSLDEAALKQLCSVANVSKSAVQTLLTLLKTFQPYQRQVDFLKTGKNVERMQAAERLNPKSEFYMKSAEEIKEIVSGYKLEKCVEFQKDACERLRANIHLPGMLSFGLEQPETVKETLKTISKLPRDEWGTAGVSDLAETMAFDVLRSQNFLPMDKGSYLLPTSADLEKASGGAVHSLRKEPFFLRLGIELSQLQPIVRKLGTNQLFPTKVNHYFVKRLFPKKEDKDSTWPPVSPGFATRILLFTARMESSRDLINFLVDQLTLEFIEISKGMKASFGILTPIKLPDALDSLSESLLEKLVKSRQGKSDSLSKSLRVKLGKSLQGKSPQDKSPQADSFKDLARDLHKLRGARQALGRFHDYLAEREAVSTVLESLLSYFHGMRRFEQLDDVSVAIAFFSGEKGSWYFQEKIPDQFSKDQIQEANEHALHLMFMWQFLRGMHTLLGKSDKFGVKEFPKEFCNLIFKALIGGDQVDEIPGPSQEPGLVGLVSSLSAKQLYTVAGNIAVVLEESDRVAYVQNEEVALREKAGPSEQEAGTEESIMDCMRRVVEKSGVFSADTKSGLAATYVNSKQQHIMGLCAFFTSLKDSSILKTLSEAKEDHRWEILENFVNPQMSSLGSTRTAHCKAEKAYQALVESLRRSFGCDYRMKEQRFDSGYSEGVSPEEREKLLLSIRKCELTRKQRVDAAHTARMRALQEPVTSNSLASFKEGEWRDLSKWRDLFKSYREKEESYATEVGIYNRCQKYIDRLRIPEEAYKKNSAFIDEYASELSKEKFQVIEQIKSENKRRVVKSQAVFIAASDLVIQQKGAPTEESAKAGLGQLCVGFSKASASYEQSIKTHDWLPEQRALFGGGVSAQLSKVASRVSSGGSVGIGVDLSKHRTYLTEKNNAVQEAFFREWENLQARVAALSTFVQGLLADVQVTDLSGSDSQFQKNIQDIESRRHVLISAGEKLGLHKKIKKFEASLSAYLIPLKQGWNGVTGSCQKLQKSKVEQEVRAEKVRADLKAKSETLSAVATQFVATVDKFELSDSKAVREQHQAYLDTRKVWDGAVGVVGDLPQSPFNCVSEAESIHLDFKSSADALKARLVDKHRNFLSECEKLLEEGRETISARVSSLADNFSAQNSVSVDFNGAKEKAMAASDAIESLCAWAELPYEKPKTAASKGFRSVKKMAETRSPDIAEDSSAPTDSGEQDKESDSAEQDKNSKAKRANKPKHLGAAASPGSEQPLKTLAQVITRLRKTQEQLKDASGEFTKHEKWVAHIEALRSAAFNLIEKAEEIPYPSEEVESLRGALETAQQAVPQWVKSEETDALVKTLVNKVEIFSSEALEVAQVAEDKDSVEKATADFRDQLSKNKVETSIKTLHGNVRELLADYQLPTADTLEQPEATVSAVNQALEEILKQHTYVPNHPVHYHDPMEGESISQHSARLKKEIEECGTQLQTCRYIAEWRPQLEEVKAKLRRRVQTLNKFIAETSPGASFERNRDDESIESCLKKVSKARLKVKAPILTLLLEKVASLAQEYGQKSIAVQQLPMLSALNEKLQARFSDLALLAEENNPDEDAVLWWDQNRALDQEILAAWSKIESVVRNPPQHLDGLCKKVEAAYVKYERVCGNLKFRADCLVYKRNINNELSQFSERLEAGKAEVTEAETVLGRQFTLGWTLGNLHMKPDEPLLNRLNGTGDAESAESLITEFKGKVDRIRVELEEHLTASRINCAALLLILSKPLEQVNPAFVEAMEGFSQERKSNIASLEASLAEWNVAAGETLQKSEAERGHRKTLATVIYKDTSLQAQMIAIEKELIALKEKTPWWRFLFKRRVNRLQAVWGRIKKDGAFNAELFDVQQRRHLFSILDAFEDKLNGACPRKLKDKLQGIKTKFSEFKIESEEYFTEETNRLIKLKADLYTPSENQKKLEATWLLKTKSRPEQDQGSSERVVNVEPVLSRLAQDKEKLLKVVQAVLDEPKGMKKFTLSTLLFRSKKTENDLAKLKNALNSLTPNTQPSEKFFEDIQKIRNDIRVLLPRIGKKNQHDLRKLLRAPSEALDASEGNDTLRLGILERLDRGGREILDSKKMITAIIDSGCEGTSENNPTVITRTASPEERDAETRNERPKISKTVDLEQQEQFKKESIRLFSDSLTPNMTPKQRQNFRAEEGKPITYTKTNIKSPSLFCRVETAKEGKATLYQPAEGDDSVAESKV